MYSKREPFRALFPLLRHVVPLNDGNCRLTIPVVKGRCAHEALPRAFNISVFKYSTTVNIFVTNLRTWMKVVTLLFTAIFGGIFHQQCQWLAWKVWCRIWSWSPMPFEKHSPRDSVDKNRGRRPRLFSLLRPEGHVFHTAWETMVKSYYSTIADWFFPCLIHISMNFSALK